MASPAVYVGIILCALGCVRGTPYREIRPRIIGGEPVYITEYPHQVAIGEGDNVICSGSLLSTTWVITSASCCLKIQSEENLRIRAGTDNFEVGGQQLGISDFIIHPDHDRTSDDYDVCLLEMNGLVSLDETKRAVRFAYPYESPKEGELMFVTGWGRVRKDSESIHYNHLVAATVTLVSFEQCKPYWPYRVITDRMFCAGSIDTGTCQGDEGGAVVKGTQVRDTVQVGIASIISCGKNGAPGIYTNLSHPEINAFVRQYALPTQPLRRY